jgi:acyl-CoA thioester hydrolase
MQHQIRVRVRYAETDQMGIAYYANYLIWMELGRVELCRARGIRYRDMEVEDGVLLAVGEAHCRYLYPARYDEELVIDTRIGLAHPRMVEFLYEIRSAESDRKLATGATRHVFCTRDLKPVKLPRKYWSAFGITTRNGE